MLLGSWLGTVRNICCFQQTLVDVLIVQGQMRKTRGGTIDTVGKVGGGSGDNLWDKFTLLPLCLFFQVLLIAFSLTIVLSLALTVSATCRNHILGFFF